MKFGTLLILTVTTLYLAGCSKKASASSPKRFVPTSVQEITTSSDWKLAFTSKTGIKCYVKNVSEDVRRQLANNFEHPDYEYMQEPSDPSQPAYFLVMIRNNAILEELQPEETGEITGFILRNDKGFTDVLKQVK